MTNVDETADASGGDAIAALVERVAGVSEANAGARTERHGSGARTWANGEDDEGTDEPEWMADIDARMATVRDMEVEANGEFMDGDGSGAEGGTDEDAPGQFDDIFDDRVETIVDLNESSMKTTSIMAFLETFALGPESLNGGRATPTMGEVLERVKARKPESLPEWTMTAAAAASAYQFAISRKRVAEQAVARMKEAKKKHAKAQAKAELLETQLHVLQYGKTPDGKPVKLNQIKNPPHQTRPRGKLPPPPPEHIAELWKKALEKDVCHVCGEGVPDWWHPADEIVFCDGCDIQVHMSCYGLNKLPEGEWFCRGCKEGVTKGPLVSCGTPRGICAMCPHPGGALVRVDPPSKRDVPWLSPGYHAHLACALYLPEVKITLQKNAQAPMVDMSQIKSTRMNLKCSVCDEVGACTQCAMHKCFHAFHPLCSRGNNHVSLRQAITGQPMAFCQAHSAPEFEKQRFLTCGYHEDGTSDVERHSSVFWRHKADTDSPAESRVKPAVLREIADVKKAMQQEVAKPKESATDKVFPRAATAQAKRIAAMTCTRSQFKPLHSGAAPSKFLLELQQDCKQLDRAEASRLNELDENLGQAEVKSALEFLAANHPRVPQGNEQFAELAPWKYLKQHQVDALHWMQKLYSLGLGGILSFQTGLGKRITSLAFVQWVRDGLRDPGQHLILCTKETCHLWIADLHRWCTSLRSVNLMTEDDENGSQENSEKIRAAGFDYLVVPYERIDRCEALKNTTFKSVICDDWQDREKITALLSAVRGKLLRTGSTFFLGGQLDGVFSSELGQIVFPELCEQNKLSLSAYWQDTLTLSVNERVVEPPIVPAPLAKFTTMVVDTTQTPAMDALLHILAKMRKHGQKVLVISSNEESLCAVEEGLNSAKLEYARIDEPHQPLGDVLYAVARFNTLAENNISFLLCREDNLRRQQGRLSHTSTVFYLDGSFSDKIDASGAPSDERMWRAASRVWGLEPVRGTTNFVKISTHAGEDIPWKRGMASKSLSEEAPGCLTDILEKIPYNGVVSPELTAKDTQNWDAAVERKRVRAETEEPTWWALHEHNCVYCNGVPGQCKNIPPAFLPPEKAGMKIRCVACPRITSMGCAALRTVPRNGWTCPQHGCAACAKKAVPGHITFRCVSCFRAFCDSCSSGASFDAISDHPVWTPSGFTLPAHYEYVRCALCVDNLLADTKRARSSRKTNL